MPRKAEKARSVAAQAEKFLAEVDDMLAFQAGVIEDRLALTADRLTYKPFAGLAELLANA